MWLYANNTETKFYLSLGSPVCLVVYWAPGLRNIAVNTFYWGGGIWARTPRMRRSHRWRLVQGRRRQGASSVMKTSVSRDKFKPKIFWIVSPTSCFLSHFGELSNNELKNVLLVRLEWAGWSGSDLGGVAGEPAPLSSLSPLVSSLVSSFLILVLTLISSSSLFSGLPVISSPGPSSGAFVILFASLSSTALSLFRLLSFPVKINKMSH